MKRFIINCSLLIALCACAQYVTPPRPQWGAYLTGVSLTDMTADAKIAKRPVYLGAGGKLINNEKLTMNNYGDPERATRLYMENLEYELYDGLRKPGISVQRAGTDVVVILVRDALMWMDAPDFSTDGADTLHIVAKILQKYDATFIEIAGYTDAMRDKGAAQSLSNDMAKRVAIYFAQNKINTARMFVVGRGAARPIAAQDDMGRLMNRRVEIRIAPAR